MEVTTDQLSDSPYISYSSDMDYVKNCNVYIVTVPTPIDKYKQPDLSPLVKTSEMLAKVICKNDIVIYESTVYPRATEEICLPTIEKL